MVSGLPVCFYGGSQASPPPGLSVCPYIIRAGGSLSLPPASLGRRALPGNSLV